MKAFVCMYVYMYICMYYLLKKMYRYDLIGDCPLHLESDNAHSSSFQLPTSSSLNSVKRRAVSLTHASTVHSTHFQLGEGVTVFMFQVIIKQNGY